MMDRERIVIGPQYFEPQPDGTYELRVARYRRVHGNIERLEAESTGKRYRVATAQDPESSVLVVASTYDSRELRLVPLN